jgi:hypothetical protein
LHGYEIRALRAAMDITKDMTEYDHTNM